MDVEQRLPGSRQRANTARRGVTLLELLVVITIMIMLAAAAVPVFAPALQNRQVREASRMVSSYFTGARNRAMQTGRPVGVWMDRLPGMNDACVSLSYAEVPPPYSGDANSSFVVTTYSPTPLPAGPSLPYVTGFTPYNNGTYNASSDIGWMNTIRIGDMIRFNFQGPYYQIGTPVNPAAYDPTTGFLTLDPGYPPPSSLPPYANWWPLIVMSGTVTSPPNTGGALHGVPFQINRAPVKTAAAGLQLPGPIAIDLSFSGFDITNGLLDPANTNFGISPWVYTYSFQPIWPRAGVNMSTVSSSNCPFTITTPGTTRNDTSPVIITFNPSGGIDRVWCWSNGVNPITNLSVTTPNSNPVPAPVYPTTPIHLLVGKRELLPLPNTPPANTNPNSSSFQPYANWQDLTNFWVTINPQSGLVTVVENAASTTALNNGYYLNNGYGSFVELMEARQLALQSMRTRGH